MADQTHLVDPLDEPELLDPELVELNEPEPVDGVLVDVDGEVGVDVEGGVVDVEGLGMLKEIVLSVRGK